MGGAGSGKKNVYFNMSNKIVTKLSSASIPNQTHTMPKYKVGDRVKCLATRFDAAGTEDAQGRSWSQVHYLKEKTNWVCGTVQKLMGGRRWAGIYKVKYDGDGAAMNTHEQHNHPAPPIGEEHDDSSGDDGEDDASDIEEPSVEEEGADGALSDEERNAEGMMEDDQVDRDLDVGEESGDDGEDCQSLPIGGECTVKDNTWVRVAGMGEDRRGDRPKSTMSMKKMCVNSHTKRSDFWKELFPVDFEAMLNVVREGAARHKDRGVYTMGEMMACFCCFYGAAQFSVGTDAWATKRKGMMPPPMFGDILSQDKFKRYHRYISEGPNSAGKNDPWREVRWLVRGYNANRRATIIASWLIVVDETMWAWTGQGMPHLSFVKRKPEPLGAEVKNLCDGLSGVMLYLELQEGKTRMANKKFCDEEKATTACTVRLAWGAGLSELDLREEEKIMRLLVGDSWFAGHATAKALWEKLGMLFIGNVKTAHSGYPIQQLRWDLAKTERGDHVVYKLKDEHEYAVGWNDHHFKTFVATGGTTDLGLNAKRKRQTDDGKTYWKEVKRPKVLGHYYDACGQIDLHNNFRQGQLRLEKFFKTHKWNSRVLTSILSSTMVDAFRAWEHHFPPGEDTGETSSRLKSFVATVIEEIMPEKSRGTPTTPENVCESGCQLEVIGRVIAQKGKSKGKFVQKQMRCTMCRMRGNKSAKGRAPRTTYRCCIHKKVFMCAAHKGPCLILHREQQGEI